MHQGPGATPSVKEISKEVENLGVQNGRRLKMLARRRGSGEHKNTGANNGSDTECGQRPRPQTLLEPVSRLIGLSNQLVNGLPGE